MEVLDTGWVEIKKIDFEDYGKKGSKEDTSSKQTNQLSGFYKSLRRTSEEIN